MNELALFAGAGGGILGGKLLGWRTVCAVEWEPYPASVLCARQNDGLLESFPIWDDVQTFDGKPWRGIVDVISGGFPCQDISAAGRGGGITASRSSMWKHMARIISDVRPSYVFVENSPILTTRGLGTVLGDLSEMGFDAEWGVIGADNTGLPHRRKRIWVLGSNTNSQHEKRMLKQEIQRVGGIPRINANGMDKSESGLRAVLSPGLRRACNGLPGQMDRLKAVGNGQVPRVAGLAWRILGERLNDYS